MLTYNKLTTCLKLNIKYRFIYWLFSLMITVETEPGTVCLCSATGTHGDRIMIILLCLLTTGRLCTCSCHTTTYPCAVCMSADTHRFLCLAVAGLVGRAGSGTVLASHQHKLVWTAAAGCAISFELSKPHVHNAFVTRGMRHTCSSVGNRMGWGGKHNQEGWQGLTKTQLLSLHCTIMLSLFCDGENSMKLICTQKQEAEKPAGRSFTCGKLGWIRVTDVQVFTENSHKNLLIFPGKLQADFQYLSSCVPVKTICPGFGGSHAVRKGSEEEDEDW